MQGFSPDVTWATRFPPAPDPSPAPPSYPTSSIFPFNSKDGEPVQFELRPNSWFPVASQFNDIDETYRTHYILIGSGTEDHPNAIYQHDHEFTSGFLDFFDPRGSSQEAFTKVEERLRETMLNIHQSDAPTIQTETTVEEVGGVTGKLSVETLSPASDLPQQRVTSVIRTITVPKSLYGRCEETEGCESGTDGRRTAMGTELSFLEPTDSESFNAGMGPNAGMRTETIGAGSVDFDHEGRTLLPACGPPHPPW